MGDLDWTGMLKVFSAFFTGAIGIYAIFGDFTKANGKGLKLNGVISIFLISLSVIASIIIEVRESADQNKKWRVINEKMHLSISNQSEVVSNQSKVISNQVEAVKEQAKLIDRIQMNMFPIKPITVDLRLSFKSFPEIIGGNNLPKKIGDYKDIWNEYLVKKLGDDFEYKEPFSDTGMGFYAAEFVSVDTEDLNTKLVYENAMNRESKISRFDHLEISNFSELLKSRKDDRSLIYDPLTGSLQHYDTIKHYYSLHIFDYDEDVTGHSFINDLPELMSNAELGYKFSNISDHNKYIFSYYPYNGAVDVSAMFPDLISSRNQGKIVSMFDLINKVIVIETPFIDHDMKYGGKVIFDNGSRKTDIKSMFEVRHPRYKDKVLLVGRITDKDMGLKVSN